MEKWGRQCAYCGKEGVPLEVEHIVPKDPKHGPKGTNRISNLTMSCEKCNKDKSNKQPEEWLEDLQCSKKPKDELRAKNLEDVMKKRKRPLTEAALMNVCQGVSHKHMKLLQRADGWQYEKT